MAEPYPVVAAKHTYPGYDTELSPRTFPCNDPMVYPSLLGCTTETLFQETEHASAVVSCPQIPTAPQQEAPYFALCYLNSLDSWVPSPLPPLLSNDNFFIGASSYESTNTFQSDFPQFQQVDSEGIGHREHFLDGTFPSSGLTADFTHSGQFCYATFSTSDGLGARATDFSPCVLEFGRGPHLQFFRSSFGW